MEAFKVVERETKTKAYSKEGLARDQPMTAEERKRQRTREWLSELASKLSDQVDELEAEAEAVEAAGGGRSKKERDALAAMEAVMKTHRFHVDKLEAVRGAWWRAEEVGGRLAFARHHVGTHARTLAHTRATIASTSPLSAPVRTTRSCRGCWITPRWTPTRSTR